MQHSCHHVDTTRHLATSAASPRLGRCQSNVPGIRIIVTSTCRRCVQFGCYVTSVWMASCVYKINRLTSNKGFNIDVYRDNIFCRYGKIHFTDASALAVKYGTHRAKPAGNAIEFCLLSARHVTLFRSFQLLLICCGILFNFSRNNIDVRCLRMVVLCCL